MRDELFLFDTDLGGHRHGYLEYLAGEILDSCSRTLIGKNARNWIQLVRVPEVILVSADYYTVFAGSVGLARRLLGKRTTAIYIAAHNLSSHKGAVAAIKGLILRISRGLGSLDGYAITPFNVFPAILPQLCRGWIYDIQFCAANSITPNQIPDSETSLRQWLDEQNAGHSKIIIQLGYLWQSRGADQLLRMAAMLPSDSPWSVLMAGKTDDSIRSLVSQNISNPSILIHDCFLSEEMFNECLRKADLVWCYFPVEYDQSSGVFCNAFIASKPVIVRRGSALERFGKLHLAMMPLDPDADLPLPPDAVILQGPADTSAILATIRKTNRQTLEEAVNGTIPTIA